MPVPARQAFPEQITRSALLEELVRKSSQLDEATVLRAASTLLDVVERRLVEGGRVEIRGFGAFVVKERRARTGRNPMTNEVIDVKRRCTVRFKAGKHLSTRIERTKPSK